MMKSRNSERDKAWQAFLLATRNIKRGVYRLDLVRHARVFSTAPPERHEQLICLVNIASKVGNHGAAERFGAELYNWAKDNGYPSP